MAHLSLGSPMLTYTGAYLRNDFVPEAPLALAADAVARLAAGPPDQSVVLFAGDCRVPNPVPGFFPREVSNCTRACADPARMFQSSRTLFNCAVLASTDLLVRDSRLTLDPESAALNGTRGFNATAALASLAACAADGCRDGRPGAVPCSASIAAGADAITVALSRNDSAAAVQGTRDLLASYCDDVSPAPGAFTVGPGVLIAALVQALLALVFFALLKPLTTGARWLAYPYFRLRPARPAAKGGNDDAPTASAAASAFQRRLAASGPAAGLFAAASAFHDAQLWFTLAIQAAALAANLGVLPVPPSFAAKYLNDDLIIAAAVNAFLPCLLTSLLLRRARTPGRPTPHDHLDVLLVTATWAMAGSVLATQGGFSYPSAAARVAAGAGTAAACGANPPLAAYCGLERPPMTGGALIPALFAVGVGYPALPALWVHGVAWTLACRGLSDDEVRGRGRYGIGIAGVLARRAAAGSRGFGAARRVWIGIVEAVWLLLTGGTLVFLLFNAAVLGRLAAYVDVRGPVWSAGEVVALALFVPGVLRGLYMLFFGVKKAFRIPLSGDYEVVRRHKGEVLRDGEIRPFADPAANRSAESVAELPYADVPAPEGVGVAK